VHFVGIERRRNGVASPFSSSGPACPITVVATETVEALRARRLPVRSVYAAANVDGAGALIVTEASSAEFLAAREA
jgi:hypothetical protein